jgi:hypothetical protein
MVTRKKVQGLPHLNLEQVSDFDVLGYEFHDHCNGWRDGTVLLNM